MGRPDHPTVELPGDHPDLYAAAAAAPIDPQNIRGELLEALAGRQARPGHLCATAWAIDLERSHALLVNHPRFGWMPAGGHLVAGESPTQGAARELVEETGAVATEQHPLSVHGTLIPATADVEAHMHWCFGVVSLVDRAAPLTAEAGQPVRWWPLDEPLPDSFFGDNHLLVDYAELLA